MTSLAIPNLMSGQQEDVNHTHHNSIEKLSNEKKDSGQSPIMHDALGSAIISNSSSLCLDTINSNAAIQAQINQLQFD